MIYLSLFIFCLSLLLLFSVEVFGIFGKGAERRIQIFGVSLQPSEIVKVSIILALAKIYHDLRFDRIGNIDNLIFVINCNLQRLDGPVRGNGRRNQPH